MSETYLIQGMGWLPDFPSDRDLTRATKEVPDSAQKAGASAPVAKLVERAGVPDKPAKAPKSSDLREWCSLIEDQGPIGSCTAQAGVGMFEYFQRRAGGKNVELSRLFLYKATRNLLHWSGDRGAFLRSAAGAMALFGAPPEPYWPYELERYDEEPPAFCYAFAQNFQALQYYRLDPPNTARKDLLAEIKGHLASGLCVMFGFTVHESIGQATQTGEIAYPAVKERAVGGHAVLAVGYEDARVIKGRTAGAPETRGAILIRNSWGTDWGDQGYGWLPYEYVLGGLAVDWWCLIKQEWIDTGQFGL
jgi:C1A family cysteine protease